jgi:hypothetical protein
MDWQVITFGFLFGLALQHAYVNKFNTISGMATLEDYTMAKVMGFAIGLGIILIALEVQLGWADFGPKPVRLTGNLVGGLIFGTGMGILGYCPGTLMVSLGQGSLDALAGIIGGLIGGLVFTLLHPVIAPLLGPELGRFSVLSITSGNPAPFLIISILAGVLLIWLAFFFHRLEGKKGGNRWLISGIGLALINAVMIHSSVQGRTMGASTFYPYVADLITVTTDNDYFQALSRSGNWYVIFLSGALLGGLIPALIRRDFKFEVVYSRWKHYRGPSRTQRVLYALLGGFLLIFGARVAGGCASGHILSGIMKLNIASLLFALATFAAFFLTGWLFYKRRAPN